MPDQPRQRIEKVALTDQHFVMHRIQMLRHGTRIRQFAVSLFRVSHRKSFNRRLADLRHQRRHRARIHTAAQKNSQRHVAHQMAAHCLLQQFAVRLHVIAFVARRLGARRVQVPILLDLDFAVFVQFQPMPRLQLADPLIKSFFPREISKRQIFRQRRRMKFRTHPAVRQHHFDFRAEQKRFRQSAGNKAA